MKKLISVLALVLVLATLLSSCGVDYAKIDTSEYVSLDASKLGQISVEVDRINLYPTDVRQAIYEALRGKAADENKKPEGNATFEKYDTFSFYYISFDQTGKIHSSSLGLTLKSNTQTVTGVEGFESITLGFGTNRDWFADIENMLLSTENVMYLRDHIFTTTPTKEGETPAVDMSSYLLLTYHVSDASSNVLQNVTVSSPAILPSPLYADGADTSSFKDGFEKDVYLDVIYQALNALCNHTSEQGTKDSVPKLGSVFTITVKPTSEKPANFTDGVTGTSSITVYADVSFDKTNDTKDENGNVTAETFETATIRVTPRAMIGGENKSPLKLDNIVMYPKDDVKESHDEFEGNEFDIIILPYAVTPYPEMMEYDNLDTEEKKAALRDFIKKTLTDAGITPVGDDLDALKAQYEEYMYKKCDDKIAEEQEKLYKEYHGTTIDILNYFEQAEQDAKDAIWNKVLAEMVVSKIPEQNLNDYVKYREESIKYSYYHSSYEWYVPQASITSKGFQLSASTPVTGIPAAETGIYRNWKEYAVDMYASMEDESGKPLYTIGSYDDVKAILRKDGEAGIKGILSAYYVADHLGIKMDDAKYAELIKKEADTWIADYKEYYSKNYGWAMEFTVEDYEEAMGGKEVLHAQKMLELVKEELFKSAVARDGVTFKDIYADKSAVEK